MLTLAGMGKAFGDRVLFDQVRLQVNRGDRIGIVGANGAGKSTLFSVITGAMEPDTGEVCLRRNTTIGFLDQETTPLGQETVLEVASAISREMDRLRRIVQGDPELAVGDEEFGHAFQRYEAAGGFELETKAKRILTGLAFRPEQFGQPVAALSGGWRMRAHLARLLVQEPDLLLLDEPTNHLDLESLQWFQRYLKGYSGGILVISHDREFLNQFADSIVELRSGRVRRFRGNYDRYVEQREALDTQQEAAYKNQQREIGRLMTFVDRFRAKNTKASQAQSKLKQIKRMERVEAVAASPAKIRFAFPQPARSGLQVMRLSGIHFAYGSKVVYDGLELEVTRGQRIVLVGPNGAGKSTLMKLLAGVLIPRSGERRTGFKVNLGYFSQHRVEMLHSSRTVLQEAMDTPRRISEQDTRGVLGSFLFRQDDVFKRVKVLSGGEKSRLALVKLLLNPPNLLLMDEPTTHLDLASMDALVEALKRYQGTLIFISHDVYFIRAIANHVMEIRNGRLTHFHGDYASYREKSVSDTPGPAMAAWNSIDGTPAPRDAVKKAGSRRSKEQRRIEAEQRQERSLRRRRQQRIVDGLERQIEDLESQVNRLTQQLEQPDTYDDPSRAVALNRELTGVTERLKTLHPRWEEAATRLEAL